MKTYQIEPQAPLVFRSGKPFGAGSRDGANFPWPSSLAGLMRTLHMNQQGMRTPISEQERDSLLQFSSAGPILAQRENGKLIPMLPKPADALYLLVNEKDAASKAIYRLLPSEYASRCGSDLPEGLQPLAAKNAENTNEDAPKAKPQDGPAFWPLAQILKWRNQQPVKFAELSNARYDNETRAHVAIDRASMVAEDGKLFQTEGLDLGRARNKEKGKKEKGFAEQDWVFLAHSQVSAEKQMVTFGGERRLSWLEPVVSDDPLKMPDEHRETLKKARIISITLATPALFSNGWKPGWLDEAEQGMQGEVPNISGLKLKLIAAAVDRWQGISGWDLQAQAPKAARKAVAAGATYWFEIVGEPPKDWTEKLWFAPLSDLAQDRRDGFGLAIPGIHS